MSSLGNNAVDYLRFQRRINSLLGMPLFCFSGESLGLLGKYLMITYQSFSTVIVIVITIAQFAAIPHVYENMNVLCGCLSSSVHCSQLVLKTFFFIIRKRELLKHIDDTYELQERINDFEMSTFLRDTSNFPSYHSSKSRYIRITSTIQLLVNLISTGGYFLPFVYDSLWNYEELRRQHTPIVVYLGTDIHIIPLFQIVIFTLTVGFLLTNLKIVVVDNFVLNLIVLHMSQLTFHNEVLAEIKKRNEINSYDGTLREWIMQDQQLLSLYDRIGKLISPYLCIEFSYILLHTCMPAFVITSTFSWTLPQKTAVFFMVSSGIITLFLMSRAGASFSSAYKETGNDLFGDELMDTGKYSTKHAYLIIKERVRRPFWFSACTIVPLNLATFLSILRLIVSYYMTLNEISKMKMNA